MTSKIKKSKPRITAILLFLIFVSSACTIFTVQGDDATSNTWALNFQVQKTGTSSTSTTFAPLDQIQIYSNVIYGDAPQQGVLVAFKIQGPTGSADPNNITRIETTDDAGVAQFTLRIPSDNQNINSVFGTWTAVATIQTTDKSIQKTVSFTVGWLLNISSISLVDSEGNSQSMFPRDSNVTVQLKLGKQRSAARQANVL
jgi:hypothetical protein